MDTELQKSTYLYTSQQFKVCKKSKSGEHEMLYPRLEDSIDRDRVYPEPYCKYCFVELSEIKKQDSEYTDELIKQARSRGSDGHGLRH